MQGPVAVGAPNDSMGGSTALGVHETSQERIPRRIPGVSPSPHSNEDIVKISPFLGQPVFEARGVILVENRGEDFRLDQLREPLGEDVAGNSQVLLKIVEPANAQKGITEYEHGPAIPDHFSGIGHRTMQVLEALADGHQGIVGNLSCVMQLTRVGSVA
jgi:hypothetical protein